MTEKNTSTQEKKQRLRQIAELLRFSLTLDDEEIIKATIESVIELLEEESDSNN
jgi:hypothetical protein